jgi:hypothetical protein
VVILFIVCFPLSSQLFLLFFERANQSSKPIIREHDASANVPHAISALVVKAKVQPIVAPAVPQVNVNAVTIVHHKFKFGRFHLAPPPYLAVNAFAPIVGVERPAVGAPRLNYFFVREIQIFGVLIVVGLRRRVDVTLASLDNQNHMVCASRVRLNERLNHPLASFGVSIPDKRDITATGKYLSSYFFLLAEIIIARLRVKYLDSLRVWSLLFGINSEVSATGLREVV